MWPLGITTDDADVTPDEEGEPNNLRLLEHALFNRAYEGFKDNKLIEKLVEGIEYSVAIAGKALLEKEEEELSGCWDVLYSNRLSEDITTIDKLTFNKIQSTAGSVIRVLSMMQNIDPVTSTYDNVVVFVPLELPSLDSMDSNSSTRTSTALPTNEKGLVWIRGHYVKYSRSYDPEFNPYPNRLNVTFDSVSVHSIPKDIYGSYQCFAHLYMCEKYDLPSSNQHKHPIDNTVAHWDWSSFSWKEDVSDLDKVERATEQKQLATVMNIPYNAMFCALDPPFSAWSDVTYLDDTLRVMRGQQKGVYVLLKCEE